MRHLPAHVREKLERKMEREERLTPEEREARMANKEAAKKERQLHDPEPAELTIPAEAARALADALGPVLRHQREHGRRLAGPPKGAGACVPACVHAWVGLGMGWGLGCGCGFIIMVSCSESSRGPYLFHNNTHQTRTTCPIQ